MSGSINFVCFEKSKCCYFAFVICAFGLFGLIQLKCSKRAENNAQTYWGKLKVYEKSSLNKIPNCNWQKKEEKNYTYTELHKV